MLNDTEDYNHLRYTVGRAGSMLSLVSKPLGKVNTSKSVHRGRLTHSFELVSVQG